MPMNFKKQNADELISDVLLWTPTYGQAKAGRPARTYIQRLCEDTGCNPEDLPEAINDREKWWERARDIRAGGTTWWWWWYIYIYICSILVCVRLRKTLIRKPVYPFRYLNKIQSLKAIKRLPHSFPPDSANCSWKLFLTWSIMIITNRTPLPFQYMPLNKTSIAALSFFEYLRRNRSGTFQCSIFCRFQ